KRVCSVDIPLGSSSQNKTDHRSLLSKQRLSSKTFVTKAITEGIHGFTLSLPDEGFNKSSVDGSLQESVWNYAADLCASPMSRFVKSQESFFPLTSIDFTSM
ncbi:unnamed protein product, partial [Brassica oleracea]